jgi:hypothetical protein
MFNSDYPFWSTAADTHESGSLSQTCQQSSGLQALNWLAWGLQAELIQAPTLKTTSRAKPQEAAWLIGLVGLQFLVRFKV